MVNLNLPSELSRVDTRPSKRSRSKSWNWHNSSMIWRRSSSSRRLLCSRLIKERSKFRRTSFKQIHSWMEPSARPAAATGRSGGACSLRVSCSSTSSDHLLIIKSSHHHRHHRYCCCGCCEDCWRQTVSKALGLPHP